MSEAAVAPCVWTIDGDCPLPPAAIGLKAWGVNRMRRLGLRVPPAMVITTSACQAYFSGGNVLPEAVWSEVVAHLHRLEAQSGRRFGDLSCPLLLSVRSGAPQSMPGMMDTVLNLGMSTAVAQALGAQGGHPGHGDDTLARFRQQYRRVVLRNGGDAIPDDPWQQLRAAIGAVFDSWHTPRARAYRAHHGLSEDGGTGVLVQAMVFGNRDAQSGTGVLFTRSPITGAPPAWGEWLPGGQGEDVVAGERTPLPLDALRQSMPAVHAELLRCAQRVEDDAGDIQDIEFTVESGTPWLLQCRGAKRSAHAALRAAVAFAEEGRISRAEALRRIGARPARRSHHAALAEAAAGRTPLLTGLPASPGVVSGELELDTQRALARSARGESVILARPTTSPDDIQGILAVHGLLTEQGGATSHAAVVSRELGCPCIVGCGQDALAALQGRRVTLDGASGKVWAGDLTIPMPAAALDRDERKLLGWGAELLGLRVVAPAEAPTDTVDLDRLGAHWRAGLRPDASVRGRVIESGEGLQAALEIGVAGVVAQDPLATLIACLRLRAPQATRQRDAATATDESAQDDPLPLLQMLALKGAGFQEVLMEALDLDADALGLACAPLIEGGLCQENGSVLRLTASGRSRLADLLARERRTVDQSALDMLYGEFLPHNTELKRIVTDWQVKAGVPNDHVDAQYDASVLRRLHVLHAGVQPLLDRFGVLVPRLTGYAQRLDRARARIHEGDVASLSKVTRDSYHMIWFELHKELMALRNSWR